MGRATGAGRAHAKGHGQTRAAPHTTTAPHTRHTHHTATNHYKPTTTTHPLHTLPHLQDARVVDLVDPQRHRRRVGGRHRVRDLFPDLEGLRSRPPRQQHEEGVRVAVDDARAPVRVGLDERDRVLERLAAGLSRVRARARARGGGWRMAAGRFGEGEGSCSGGGFCVFKWRRQNFPTKDQERDTQPAGPPPHTSTPPRAPARSSRRAPPSACAPRTTPTRSHKSRWRSA